MLKKKLALILIGVIITSAFTGCKAKNETPNTSTTQETSDVDIEVWGTNNGFLPIEKGSALYNFYKEKTGVGIIHPYIEWNGGNTYQQQLNLRIAANDAPDMYLPVNGMENELAKNGSIIEISKQLQEKAPNYWKIVPESIWEVQKTYDPNGKGGIYSVPNILSYGRNGGMIRKDWLDKLGLSMPTNQDELVKVLQAFRDKDPNGNGQKDEIPMSGRQEGTWMDTIFAMYGVAMWEGKPDWDIYDGKLTYSAVSKNMRDALEFAHKLYAEGLLDKETFLNDRTKYMGKIDSNKVGAYFHIDQEVHDRLDNINKAFNIKPDIAALPAISAPGYQGFYTMKKMIGPAFVIKDQKDQKKVDACFKLLNAYADQGKWNDYYLGVKDMHYKLNDAGKSVKLPDDKTKQQNLLLTPYNGIATLQFNQQLLKNVSADSPDRKWSLDQSVRNMEENQKYVKGIAGDGMPSSVYEGYPDILNRTLYVQYMTKIIIGDYPISKFDEFVDKWNKAGGEAVTKSARDWYAKVKK
jgi:putative aldouronate transport system substrate-binding protein